MNSFEKFRLPHMVFGEGCSKQAGAKLKMLGCKKTLIVTDKGVMDVGIVDPIAKTLKDEGIDYMIYDKTLPNPPDYVCIEVAKIIVENDIDSTLAIGGGSSTDTAKAANLIANLPGGPDGITDLHEYGGTGTLMKPEYTRKTKFIAVPTTSGTGAEVTVSAVLYDPKLDLKYSFMNENMVADMILVDPELTYGMPPRATATVGLDAFTHALEVVVGVVHHDFGTPLALDAIRRIWRWLPIVVKDGKNKEGRAQLSYAATMAESTGGAANGHCVSHAIGARYEVVHGHACIMVAPTLVRHQAKCAEDRIRMLADVIGVPSTGTADEVAGYVADAILEFYKSLGFETCRKLLETKGIKDDKQTFINKLKPAVLDDFKSRNWEPPIHRPEDNAELEKVLGMIYDEE